MFHFNFSFLSKLCTNCKNRSWAEREARCGARCRLIRRLHSLLLPFHAFTNFTLASWKTAEVKSNFRQSIPAVAIKLVVKAEGTCAGSREGHRESRHDKKPVCLDNASWRELRAAERNAGMKFLVTSWHGDGWRLRLPGMAQHSGWTVQDEAWYGCLHYCILSVWAQN